MYLAQDLEKIGFLRHLMLIGSSYEEIDYYPYLSSIGNNFEPKEWLFDSFVLFPNVQHFSLGADINIGTTMSGEGDFYAVPCPNPGNKEAWLTAIDSL
ncbi:MAG: hypothetical protein WCY40_05625, partial [Defluviitoga tunisiensis]